MSQPSPAARRQATRSWRMHLRDLRAFDAELSQILSDAAREADRIVRASIDTDAGIGARVRRAQYSQANKALKQLVADMYDGPINAAMLRAIEEASRTALEGMNLINSVLANSGVSTSLGESFEYAARRASENVRSRLINDIKLSRKVYKTKALSQKWVQREINRALALGRSTNELALVVRHLIAPNVRGGVSYAARRLARTEINNAFHTSTIRMAARQPWVEGFKWELSGSHSRPDPCDDFAQEDHDGLGAGVFKKGNVPSKPHPQCLCYVTVVQIGEDEFLDNLVAGRYDRYLTLR